MVALVTGDFSYGFPELLESGDVLPDASGDVLLAGEDELLPGKLLLLLPLLEPVPPGLVAPPVEEPGCRP
jgi:hypothetical protein